MSTGTGTAMPGLRVVVLVIAISVPIFLGVETLLRVYVFGPIYGPLLADLRALYWPELSAEIIASRATTAVWVLIGVTLLAGVVGILALRRVIRRASNASGEQATPAKIRDQLLLLTSIPQVPGLLSTLCFAVGAELSLVLICVAISTAFVVLQGFVGERAIERMGAAAADPAC